MLKPGVSDTQVMVPAKMIKLGMIVVFGKIFLCIENTVGSNDVGATVPPLTRTRVSIYYYDLSVHLTVVRKGLGERELARGERERV